MECSTIGVQYYWAFVRPGDCWQIIDAIARCLDRAGADTESDKLHARIAGGLIVLQRRVYWSTKRAAVAQSVKLGGAGRRWYSTVQQTILMTQEKERRSRYQRQWHQCKASYTLKEKKSQHWTFTSICPVRRWGYFNTFKILWKLSLRVIIKSFM